VRLVPIHPFDRFPDGREVLFRPHELARELLAANAAANRSHKTDSLFTRITGTVTLQPLERSP